VATGGSFFYCQPNGLLASHFESFSIDLTGFRTIEKIYPQLSGLLQGVVFNCQPNGRLVTPFASFPID